MPFAAFRNRSHRLILAVVSTALLFLPLAGVGTAHAQPGPATIPLTITNATGSTEPVYVYVLATDNTDADGDNLGYIDASGAFRPWPKVTRGTHVPAPDVSIPGPTNGEELSLKVPTNVSGRIYYSVGEKLAFSLVGTDIGTTGLVQPAPWAPSDPTSKTLFDWTEFTLNGQEKQYTGLWINSTQVDQLAIPTEVEVTGTDGKTSSAGKMRPGGRQAVIDTLLSDPKWADTVVTDDEGQVIRVLSPGHATTAGLLDPNYLAAYIDTAWAAYESRPLTIVPFSDQPEKKFFGRTSGTVMTFTDVAGKQVAAFERPKSVDVWGCDGALNGIGNVTLPNDLTTGPISRTLCAALIRGTLGTMDTEPVTNTASYYQNIEGLNLYGKTVHGSMVDGRAYAFAFDDVGGHESLVYNPRPAGVRLTLQPLAEESSPTDPGTDPDPTDPGTDPDPTDPAAGTQVIQVKFTEGHPGYATLTLGEGTGPGIVTMKVDGGGTSTAAVTGAGQVRVDLSGPVGTRNVTISSTGTLGRAKITMPTSPPQLIPPPGPGMVALVR